MWFRPVRSVASSVFSSSIIFFLSGLLLLFVSPPLHCTASCCFFAAPLLLRRAAASLLFSVFWSASASSLLLACYSSFLFLVIWLVGLWMIVGAVVIVGGRRGRDLIKQYLYDLFYDEITAYAVPCHATPYGRDQCHPSIFVFSFSPSPLYLLVHRPLPLLPRFPNTTELQTAKASLVAPTS